MLRANELRIGNWILFGEKNVQVEFIDPDEDFSVVEPIPLTPEILEKAGFAKFKTDIYDKGRLRIWNGLAYLKDEDIPQAYYIPNRIYYLHQLQNLYFALTGNELEINL